MCSGFLSLSLTLSLSHFLCVCSHYRILCVGSHLAFLFERCETIFLTEIDVVDVIRAVWFFFLLAFSLYQTPVRPCPRGARRWRRRWSRWCCPRGPPRPPPPLLPTRCASSTALGSSQSRFSLDLHTFGSRILNSVVQDSITNVWFISSICLSLAIHPLPQN